MSKNKSNNSTYVRPDIDYNKLAEAIVKAHKKIKETEEKDAKRREKEERKEWLDIIGYKEIELNLPWHKKKLQSIKNDFATLKVVFTFKAENAKTPRLTFELMRLGTGLIYGISEWLLYLLGAFFIASPFIMKDKYFFDYGNIGIGFLSIFFGKIIRIAKLEVENVNDKEMLNTIFSANMTFVGIVLAIIAIVIEVV